MPVLVADFDAAPQQIVVLTPPVDIPSDGFPIRVQWNGASGATDIEITRAEATISPDIVEQNLGVLTVTSDGQDYLVAVPSGKRIRYLTLDGVKTDEDVTITSSGDLSGQRLAVTVQSGGSVPSPQYSVPACPRRGMIPQSLTGASLENKVLALPDVAGNKIRLSMVDGDSPDSFSKHSWTLGEVTGVAAGLPHNLSLVEPDGSTAVWAFPGEMPTGSPTAFADLRMSVKKLAAAALKSGQPLDFTFKVKADSPARIVLSVPTPSGSLVRTFLGVLPNLLAGDPVVLPLTAPNLASEQPASVTAGVTVTYQGMRILESVSDAFPSAAGNVGGIVVGEDLVLRIFPPKAFDELAPARVGVIGRAPVDCELSIQLLEMNGNIPGKAIAPPGVVRLSSSNTLSTVWIDLKLDSPPRKALACAVRANQGRFLWAANEHGLTRVAVNDPDPGNRPLLLNGVSLANVSQKTTQLAADLPQAQFTGAPPILTSNLFLKVDFSDLTLRYAR